MSAERVNQSCGACRMAKVKCLREEGAITCTRCARNGIECIAEQRRSKWDNKATKSKAPPLGAMVLGQSAPAEYGHLISELVKFSPAAPHGGVPAMCFRFQVKKLLTELIELTIQANDASTLGWAMGQVAAHGFPLDAFPAFRRGDKEPANGSSSNGGGSSSVVPAQETGPLTCAILLELPAQISQLFAGNALCILSVAEEDQPKRYLVNDEREVSVEALEAARSMEEYFAALRVMPSDASRIWLEHGQTWEREKAAAMARALDAPKDAEPEVAVYGPYLLRRQVEDASGGTHFALYSSRMTACILPGTSRMYSVIRYTRVERRGSKRQKPLLEAECATSSSGASHEVDYLSDGDIRSLVHDMCGESGERDSLLEDFLAATSGHAPSELPA
jgi:hypothetical protein